MTADVIIQPTADPYQFVARPSTLMSHPEAWLNLLRFERMFPASHGPGPRSVRANLMASSMASLLPGCELQPQLLKLLTMANEVDFHESKCLTGLQSASVESVMSRAERLFGADLNSFSIEPPGRPLEKVRSSTRSVLYVTAVPAQGYPPATATDIHYYVFGPAFTAEPVHMQQTLFPQGAGHVRGQLRVFRGLDVIPDKLDAKSIRISLNPDPDEALLEALEVRTMRQSRFWQSMIEVFDQADQSASNKNRCALKLVG